MNPLFLNYNGNIISSATPLVKAGSRGLRYGDGLFETMRLTDGTISFAESHFNRLFSGMKLMSFEIPDYFTSSYLLNCIIELCKLNEHMDSARVRLMILRGEGTLQDPDNNFPQLIIETFSIPAHSSAATQGIVTGIYENVRKGIDGFSHIKSNNYQPYVLASFYAKRMGWDDCILLNTDGHICESTIANIFIIKDGTIITPPLTQGCVAGIMRKYILSTLPGIGFTVLERALSPRNLYEADEVFLTNAIQGIKYVAQTGDAFFTNNIITNIKNAIGY